MMKFSPHRKRRTGIGTVALFGITLKAGYRCKISLGQAQDFTDIIFFGFARQTIAAALA